MTNNEDLPEKGFVWPGGIKMVLCKKHLQEYLNNDFFQDKTIERAPNAAVCSDCEDDEYKRLHTH